MKKYNNLKKLLLVAFFIAAFFCFIWSSCDPRITKLCREAGTHPIESWIENEPWETRENSWGTNKFEEFDFMSAARFKPVEDKTTRTQVRLVGGPYNIGGQLFYKIMRPTNVQINQYGDHEKNGKQEHGWHRFALGHFWQAELIPFEDLMPIEYSGRPDYYSPITEEEEKKDEN